MDTGGTGPIDSLLPIADHLARSDLVDVLVPRYRGIDRGVVLERQWRSIDISFDEMLDLQQKELRPAIIFSPTIAERGTPLEISSFLWSHRAKDSGDIGLSLFEAFPEAHGKLRLSTATRLSATFPLISPAAVLPTQPQTWHLVDAGYFDNDGIDPAAKYLRDADVIDWLAEEAGRHTDLPSRLSKRDGSRT